MKYLSYSIITLVMLAIGWVTNNSIHSIFVPQTQAQVVAYQSEAEIVNASPLSGFDSILGN